jgi:phenylalanyl-tRNA synthetase beta subunit
LYGTLVDTIGEVVALTGRPAIEICRLDDGGSLRPGARTAVGAADLEVSWRHPARHGLIYCGQWCIGYVSMLHPRQRSRLEVPAEVAIAEIDLGALLEQPVGALQARAPSRFPAMSFDLTVRVGAEVRDAEVRAVIERSAREATSVFEGVELLAVYEQEQVDDSRRALTYRIRCRSAERTLAESELSEVESAVISGLEGHASSLVRSGDRSPIDLVGRGTGDVGA